MVHGSDTGCLVGRIAHSKLPGLGHEPGSELIKHRLLDEEALNSGAALAGVAERPLGRQRGGEVEVGVTQYD